MWRKDGRIVELQGILRFNKDRVKKWMRKYRELGEFGLLDQRGRREEYIDQDRHVQKLKRENEMLKKCLEIWMQEVIFSSIQPLRKHPRNTVLPNFVNSLVSPEVDITPS
ncbi:helix-turn-helix domain-containing protein [Paenibacillus glacialis]|uniref:helix-turn-helix domain-containing protein n=1 Tax=Paenibacillus glacialis TaxID=494026 RepID=UPI001FE10689|nr:helix-turn-helix domain-containing protein [Paenibacillus glacialis]